MADTITEIVFLPLKLDLNLSTGEHKAILDDTLTTIAQQPGLNSLVWGLHVKNPNVLEIIQEWAHIKHHTAFQESSGYQPFLDRLSGILDGAPLITHANIVMRDKGENPLDAPITECLYMYFPAEHDENKYLEENWVPFQAGFSGSPDVEARGVAGGWSTELHEHASLGEGVKGKMFVVLLGWPSMRAPEEFQKTRTFAKVMPLLSGGVRGAEARQVGFVRIV